LLAYTFSAYQVTRTVSKTQQITEARIRSGIGWGLTKRIENYGLNRFKANMQRVSVSCRLETMLTFLPVTRGCISDSRPASSVSSTTDDTGRSRVYGDSYGEFKPHRKCWPVHDEGRSLAQVENMASAAPYLRTMVKVNVLVRVFYHPHAMSSVRDLHCTCIISNYHCTCLVPR
jgi:hypothetical protein